VRRPLQWHNDVMSGAMTDKHDQSADGLVARAVNEGDSSQQLGEADVEALRCACRVCARAKDWAAAVAHGTSLLAVRPDDIAVLWWVGSALSRMRRDREALGHLERAVELVLAGDRAVEPRVRTRHDDDDEAESAPIEARQPPSSPRSLSLDEIARMKTALRECRGRLGEIPLLCKFPRTAHLMDAGGTAVTVDDLVMSPVDLECFVGSGRVVTVEEKVDGANLGVSIAADHRILFQNRAHYVNDATHAQFSGLSRWADEHAAALHAILDPERHVLFGEWCALKHSLHYARLPALFLAFDLLDRETGEYATRPEVRDANVQTHTFTQLCKKKSDLHRC
jgi:hypothetical protein